MTPDAIQALAIQLLVVVMMLAVGTKLTLTELFAVRRHARAFGWALAANFIAVPALTLALCSGLSLGQPVSVALLLCACAPGGPVGPLYVTHARGDLAYAVALMAILAMISTLTTPLLLVLAVLPNDGGALSSSVVALLKTMVAFQLLPLVLGLAYRHVWPSAALRVAPVLTRLSNLLLLGVVVGLLVLKGHVLVSLGAESLAVMVFVVVASLVLGGLAGSGTRELLRASALCTGVRNLAMALLLSASHFPDPETDAAILSFGLIMLVLPAALAARWKREAP